MCSEHMASYGKILLPGAILLLLIRETCHGYRPEHEKCRIWLKTDHPNAKNISIECYDVDLTNLNDLVYLRKFLDTIPSPCKCLSLSMINFKYPNGALQDDWFCSHGILNLNIQSLRIQGGLNQIEASGWRCLPVLESLTLSGTGIRHLWRNPFRNIPNLNRFELRSDDFLTSADPDILSGMTRITFLSITNTNMDERETGQFLRNLVSDGLELETIDLSYNNLGLLPAEVVARLPKMRTMDLRSSKLRGLGDAFNELKEIKVLILYNNEISVIPESNRKLIERLSALYMRKNPIMCDCSMVWLQKYINEKRNGTFGDFKNVVCAEPLELRNVPFLKAKMCGTSPKPPPGCPAIEITCRSTKDNTTRQLNAPKNIGITEAYQIVKLEGEKQNFTLIQNDTTDRVTISIDNGIGRRKTILYWSNTEMIRPDYKCVTDITENFAVTVQHNTNYIICVFDRTDRISLTDCKSFTTGKRYSDQVWLANRMKLKVSVIAGVSLLTALLTGGGLAYLLFRRNPSLLRGSKRVITVKSYKPSVLVMPKGYNNPVRGQAEYVDVVNEETSSTASYISALPPSPSELLEYRLQSLRKYPHSYPPL